MSFGSTPFGSTPFAGGGTSTFGTSTFGTSTPSFGTSGFGTGQSTMFSTQATGVTPGQTGGFGSQPVFGATPSTQGGLTFGTPLSGQGFGATATGAAATTTSGTALGFGGTQTSFGFGQTTAAPATGFGSALSFGTTPASTTAQPAATALSFQANPAATTAASGFSFGLGTTPAATTQTFSFNPPASTALQSSGGLNFGATPFALGTGAKPGGGLGLGMPANASSLLGKPMAPSTTVATAPTTAVKPTLLGGVGGPPTPIEKAKDNLLPPDMITFVDAFKGFVKEQKSYSSEVSKASLKTVKKVSEDTEVMRQMLIKLERTVHRNKVKSQKIKEDTIRGLSDCETGHVTHDPQGGFYTDTPPPLLYFCRLVERFQEQVLSLRLEVENTEKHLSCVLNPRALTPQELSLSLQRVHECFVALAGRLHHTHSSVTTMKQQQLDIRRKKLNDFRDIFNKKESMSELSMEQTTPDPSPTPFSGARNYHTLNMVAASRAKKYQGSLTMGVVHPPTAVTPLPVFGGQGMMSAFGSLGVQRPSGLLPTPMSPSIDFQLKPPPSNKRGKR